MATVVTSREQLNDISGQREIIYQVLVGNRSMYGGVRQPTDRQIRAMEDLAKSLSPRVNRSE